MTSIDWSAMTAEEIAAVLDSAPVVLGEWVVSPRRAERVRHGHVSAGAHAWVDEFGGTWRWGVIRGGGTHREATREAAMAAADSAARERGWRLMGGRDEQ